MAGNGNGDGTVKVWDPLVRILHWSLVVAFTVAYLSSEEESVLHVYSGYVVLGVILIRVVWGLIGTRHARFSDFVRSPREVLGYLGTLATRHPRHYLGHNPAGGWMVLALLASLFVVTISGVMLDSAEGDGTFAAVGAGVAVISQARADSDEDGEYGEREGSAGGEAFWEEVHGASANMTVFLVFLHIAGVLAASVLHRENLVRAMITGRKVARERPEGGPPDGLIWWPRSRLR